MFQSSGQFLVGCNLTKFSHLGIFGHIFPIVTFLGQIVSSVSLWFSEFSSGCTFRPGGPTYSPYWVFYDALGWFLVFTWCASSQIFSYHRVPFSPDILSWMLTICSLYFQMLHAMTCRCVFTVPQSSLQNKWISQKPMVSSLVFWSLVITLSLVTFSLPSHFSQ